jgi:hypothetical protein
MPGTSPRTRLIFQNSNLFVHPIGSSGQGATGTFNTAAAWNSGNVNGSTVFTTSPLITELSRIQSIDLTVGIPRQDINVFGRLNRIDAEVLTPPTVGLNFSYFVTDGFNEYKMGFSAKGNGSFVSGFIVGLTNDKNYFISYSPQGQDDDGFANPNQRDVIGIGNGFITNYSLNAAVAQPVTASVTVDAFNVAFYNGTSGKSGVAVFPSNSAPVNGWVFNLPQGSSQFGPVSSSVEPNGEISILRPGDITLTLPSDAGFGSAVAGAYAANIQSFTLAVPINRQRIQKLGSPFGISNEIQFPVNCTLSIQALQTDLVVNSLDQLLCNDTPKNITIRINQPGCAGVARDSAVTMTFNGAFLNNYALGQTIGGDATLTLDYTAQLAGATSTDGFTFSGSYTGAYF